MSFSGKKLALSAIGSALALSFAVFGVLFVRYDRGDDPNNEDGILGIAQQAEADDNPPLAAFSWRRLVALNPFKEEYVRRYYHALVRVRDFSALASYTNDMPMAVEMTASEKAVEELLFRGATLEMAHSNELAAACYAEATNLNYYAAAPFLINCLEQQGEIGTALHVARSYIRRFPSLSFAIRTAEWCALADRPDLIAETSRAIPADAGYSGVLLGYYCDALTAWLNDDKAALSAAIEAIGSDTIKTPVSRMMALESAADGDNATRLAIAYRLLADEPPFLDFLSVRGPAAVKRFVAAHFPDKMPIEQLGRLSNMVLEDGHQDIDLLRVSLLAAMADGTLDEGMIAQTESLYPGDKGIKAIRDEYERAKSKAR